MTNKDFDNTVITKEDLVFICYMIERVARKLHQRNKYIINTIDRGNLNYLINIASVSKKENPEQVEEEWIYYNNLGKGTFNIKDVDNELCSHIPTPLDMGKVYARLIIDTALEDEVYLSGIIRVYNDEICETLDNYNNGAFYEPSYVIARAYKDGGF